MASNGHIPPLILVDVMNLAFRTHFVFQNLSSNERPSGVLYGFLKTIYDLRESVSRRILIVWDHGVPVNGAPKPRNWRDDLLPAYKGTRVSNPIERLKVFSQLPLLNEVINLLGYPQIGVMGLEADDVIGILSSRPRYEGEETLIFSTDHDFYQLLDEEHTHILVPKKVGGAFRKIFQSDIEREYGFPISRWPEYLALGGDKSDNIKPMRGMGPKTAAKLIRQGIDLEQPLSSQPAVIQQKYSEAWEAIQKSYFAARLPRAWSDSRICTVVKSNAIFLRNDGYQHWASEKVRMGNQAAYAHFCADYELATLLGLKRSFFS